MKYFFNFFIFLMLSIISCTSEECKEASSFTGYNFIAPIDISPAKIKYKIGDTIFIKAHFSSRMKERNTGKEFYVPNFPFDTYLRLYQFDKDLNWSSGFRSNQILIDSFNFKKYIASSVYGDRITIKYIEKDNMYSFDAKLILKSKGRYVFIMEDLLGSYSNSDTNPEKYRFDGQCTVQPLKVINICDNPNDINLFIPELLIIDNVIFRNRYSSIKDTNATGPFKDGIYNWEFVSTYCFEVE